MLLPMRYLLALIFPPLAVLLWGTGGQALVNLLLTACLWLPGVLHAWIVVSHSSKVKETRLVVSDMRAHRLHSILHKQK